VIEWLDLLVEWSGDAVKHWLLAASLAFAAYLLMRGTLYVLLSAGRALSKLMGVAWLSRLLSLLFALLVGFLSHWALDYFWQWWNTPLGPPLDLVR
jgi:Zn-dependent protease with chaperone function